MRYGKLLLRSAHSKLGCYRIIVGILHVLYSDRSYLYKFAQLQLLWAWTVPSPYWRRRLCLPVGLRSLKVPCATHVSALPTFLLLCHGRGVGSL